MRGQGAADLAGPEHDMQPILTHDQVLSLTPSSLAVGDSRTLDACGSRYAPDRQWRTSQEDAGVVVAVHMEEPP